MSRYKIFMLFVLFSVFLFLTARYFAGIVYVSGIGGDLMGQFTDVIDVLIKSMAVYLVALITTAVVGLWVSQSKGNTEFASGFRLSLLFCCLLIILYLITVLTLR